MGIFDRLFGKHPADKNKQSTAAIIGSTSPEAMSDQWRQFFNILNLHESAETTMMAFVGKWPEGLDPNVFSKLDTINFPLLIRILKYRTMPYPLRGPLFTTDDLPRPNYKMVDGKIARASTPIDMIFIEVVSPNVKKKFKRNEKVSPGQVVWELILYYSEFPLAKLIFILPSIYSASEAAKRGKAAIMVIEDMLIQVYMGVENILFDVYSDLPEGGVLSDEAITKKLKSLLAT